MSAALGHYSFRFRGSLSKIASMIPGMPANMMGEGGEEEAASKLKRMVFITDAMRQDELDSDGLIFVRVPSPQNPRHQLTGYPGR
jgi:signal recognition particle subunit SRP54